MVLPWHLGLSAACRWHYFGMKKSSGAVQKVRI
nr:MAG TPA: Protein of unknown function (DUF2499) [Caudoviricetes sp.]